MMISGTFRCLYLLFRCIQCILLSASLFVLTVLGLYLFGFVFVFYFSIAPWFTFFFSLFTYWISAVYWLAELYTEYWILGDIS